MSAQTPTSYRPCKSRALRTVEVLGESVLLNVNSVESQLYTRVLNWISSEVSQLHRWTLDVSTCD